MTEDFTPGDRALLADTFLLRDVEGALEAALGDPRCIRARAEKGEVIFAPDHFRRCLAVLLEGEVEVRKGDLILNTLTSGELFGAASLFNDREDYAVTLTAQRACRLVFLLQGLVEELMACFPAVARNYVTYLSGRIRFLDGKIDALIAGSAERKLAQQLLGQVQDGWVMLDCSATGLAARLNISRASLYRAFETLTAAGLIARTGKRVHILDPPGLRQV